MRTPTVLNPLNKWVPPTRPGFYPTIRHAVGVKCPVPYLSRWGPSPQLISRFHFVWSMWQPASPIMLDLCSGLGGASQAFHDAGWDCRRFDNNKAFRDIPRTWIGDLLDITPHRLHRFVHEKRVELLWASPPCLEFSNAYGAPGPTAAREGRPFQPDLSLFEKCIEIRDEMKPKFWCFENVVGAISHLEPLLGPPTQIIGPFVLWTNLPHIAMDPSFEHRKEDHDTWSSNPLRANIKAKIPLELSKAVLAAASSPTLEDFQ